MTAKLKAFLTLLLALLAGLGAGTCVTLANGSEARGTLAALNSLPVYHQDRAPELADEKRAQYEAIAAAVDKHGRGLVERALTIAHIYSETALSLRITDGQCRKWECDRGRARGLGQLHRNGMSLERWDRMHGLGNIDAQIQETTLRIRRALAMCGTPEGAMRSLTGRGCSARLPGIEKRLATYRRVLGRL